MIQLSDVSWEDLFVGMALVSSLTGWQGEIVKLVPNDDDNIWIDWGNGRKSQVYHTQATKVLAR